MSGCAASPEGAAAYGRALRSAGPEPPGAPVRRRSGTPAMRAALARGEAAPRQSVRRRDRVILASSPKEP
ncbi:hypothetical protein Acsp04_23430 [Actinomadura sp. NBRC 104425]|nr:hypothetical protein Acsp04_23430 [Actinomadura sp. NBRC 104425]